MRSVSTPFPEPYKKAKPEKEQVAQFTKSAKAMSSAGDEQKGKQVSTRRESRIPEPEAEKGWVGGGCRGRGGQVRIGVAEEGAPLHLVSTARKKKNSFQKLEWAQCLILIAVTSGDLFPLQTISWVF